MKRIACILLLALATFAAQAQSPGTAFTIQGRLHDEAGPSPGPVDLRLTPFNAASDGTAMELPVELTGVPLRDGVFSVDVDFGPLPFLGDPVWIAVEVRGPGDADYVPLEPRQRVAPTPYAIHAGSVGVDAVDGFAIRDGAVDATKLAPGAVGASAIDPTQVQRRIGPDCAAGEAIGGVAEDGTTTCVPTGDSDWNLWAEADLVSRTGRVSVGTSGYRGAKMLVWSDSTIGAPQLELMEPTYDYARLSLTNLGSAGSSHFGFWTIAARTFTTEDGGPAEDRINFFNNRTGDAMSLLGDGRLGIGVFEPEAALDVDGSARLRGLADGAFPNYSRRLNIDEDGNLAASPWFRYLSIPHVAFKPSDGGPYTMLAGTFSGAAGTGTTAHAPIMVEGPVQIISFTAWIKDSSTGKDLEVSFVRSSPTTNAAAGLGTVVSSGTASPTSYAEYSVTHTGPVYDGTQPLIVYVRPVVAGTTSTSTWDSDLGISAIRLQLAEP